MNLDAEIKAAQQRLSRRIGQWGRRDDRIRAGRAEWARIQTEADFERARQDIRAQIRAYPVWERRWDGVWISPLFSSPLA